MLLSTGVTMDALRSQHHRPVQPLLPRLRTLIAERWQRRVDRAVERSMAEMDHAGVQADYRIACRFRRH